MVIRAYIIQFIFIGFGCLYSTVTSGQIYMNIGPQNNIVESYGPAMIGGGVSFCDFDGDGWDDLTFSSCAGDSVHFYKNVNGTFQKLPSLVDNIFEVTQILWADYDNDGDKDLFLASNLSSNKLYENTGNLNLIDITISSGISTSTSSTYSANWLDYNKDGQLDLFVSNYSPSSSEVNELYKNNGDGTFSNTAAIAGVRDSLKEPLASACLDFNNDTWPDIYTAQDKFTINSLFQNNHNGSFTNIAASSGSDLAINSMSASIGDYDNNGFLDIYSTNTQAGNKLLKNNGDSSFTEVAGISGTTFNGIAWGAQFLDYDLDMDQDLYVSGSLIPGQGGPSSAFYKNNDDGTFNLSNNSGFLGDTVRSYGNAIGDINNDGFPDIAVCNLFAPHHVWKNNSGNGTWLKINLEGVISNRDAIGTWIEVYAKNQKQVKYTVCGQGFISQNSFTEFFGLYNAPIVDSIIVKWPSGIIDIFYNIIPNQTLMLTETETHCNPFNPISISSAVKQLSCTGTNEGAIKTFISGGTPPYDFLWNTTLPAVTSAVNNLSSGNYSLLISDANNCSTRKNYTLKEIHAIVVQSVINNPSSNGSADGQINLSAVGGTGTLQYLWWNGSVSSNIIGLVSGVYYVQLKDENGCSQLHYFTLIDP